MKLTNLRKQKFRRGDLVKIADDLGPSMAHFEKGCTAIVLGSYADLYSAMSRGGYGQDRYCLLVISPRRGVYSCSWYDEDQLALIVKDFVKVLEKELTEEGF